MWIGSINNQVQYTYFPILILEDFGQVCAMGFCKTCLCFYCNYTSYLHKTCLRTTKNWYRFCFKSTKICYNPKAKKWL